ncbi:HAD hydrolase-like protein [Bifidobacterium xylocopae]|uniref:Haloacid dehalogenase n=1 Tax=Bifidobacterium xylocopae TaxID=2493119 RepID=A0A366KCH4_9BIFI|nr:HAD hydrolase-like protein [Bifidobacterium xylocopae]RBP99269.1 haloacid dehalogenase [Bifidobacterium xylocopae]
MADFTPVQARKIVLLDLDGTLIASHPGILASVRKMFEGLGLAVPPEEELRRFIGPSIADSLRRNHVEESLIPEGIAIYRKYYNDYASFEDPAGSGHLLPGSLCSSVFPGIPAQLEDLRSSGFHLSVASCKPEYQARPICQHFRLDALLDDIFGASRDGSRVEKAQVISYGFAQLGFNPDAGDRALMVGDRWTDADGAQALGLDCLGCGWGYAEDDELSAHGCYRVINHVNQLSQAVNEYFMSLN